MNNNINEYIFKIHLTGNEIIPENLNLPDLSNFLLSINTVLMSIIKKNENTDDIILGLTQIKKSGSIDLNFNSLAPNARNIVLSGFLFLTTIINQNNFSKLPSNSIEPLKKIASFVRDKNCKAEFFSNENNIEKLEAQITPETVIEIPKDFYLKTFTNLYGTIERVGGKEPKVRLKIDDNKTITCNASIDITKELGKKLYSYVGISGIAKYHPVDLEIIEFKIEEVLPFEDNRIAKGFKELSENFSCYFKDVDPEKFVEEIRG